jgi:hypothetical protein
MFKKTKKVMPMMKGKKKSMKKMPSKEMIEKSLNKSKGY